MTLTAEEQQRRREWFRSHWETGVAFNRASGISVRRWDPDGVELVLPYRDDLSAHDGIFHGGVIAALVDTAGCGAVAAGHDFDNGSRISTTMLSLQYLAAVPTETVVAHATCIKRGRRTHYADVTVRSLSGVAVARGLVTINTGGERRGLEDVATPKRAANGGNGSVPAAPVAGPGDAAPVAGPGDAVRRYFDAANDRDIEAMRVLFAPDAEWVHPVEGTLRGRHAIAARYGDFFVRGGADLEVTSLVVEGARAVAEVRGRIGNAPGPVVVNHYTFDDEGLIARLAVYRGPVGI